MALKNICEHRLGRCEINEYLGAYPSILKQHTRKYCLKDKMKCPLYKSMCRDQEIENSIERLINDIAIIATAFGKDIIRKYLREERRNELKKIFDEILS